MGKLTAAHAGISLAGLTHYVLTFDGSRSEALLALLSPAGAAGPAPALCLANAAISAVLGVHSLVRWLFLGPLSVTEAHNVTERCFTLFLIKLVSFLALLSEPDNADCAVYTLWALASGCLAVHAGLCRDRLEALNNSPNASRLAKSRALALLAFLALSTLGICRAGLALFDSPLFVLHDSLLLCVSVAQLLLHTCVSLSDGTAEEDRGAEWRRSLVFAADCACECAADLLGLLHAWLCCWMHGLSLTLLDVVLLLYARMLACSLLERLRRVHAFALASRALSRSYPDVQALDELCAVCRERLEVGKRLPCGHMLHRACLQRWLERVASCPICRRPL
jgi:hypothetical protein